MKRVCTGTLINSSGITRILSLSQNLNSIILHWIPPSFTRLFPIPEMSNDTLSILSLPHSKTDSRNSMKRKNPI
jgi:hypothetical protein